MDPEISLRPGEVLYREGDLNDFGYIVESGEVVLYNTVSGERTEFEKRGPGALIGELSILTGQPRAVTVEAVEPCTLFRISAEQILDRFAKLDPILRACIETSISFASTLSQRAVNPSAQIEVAPITLRDASKLIEQFKFERDIDAGIERQEFSLVYQPIVELSTGGIVGVEALMRWQHSTLGNVPPFRFIEAAEATGSIGKLTEFALAEACGALRRMRATSGSTPDFYVSVNVSGKDIGHAAFVDYVSHVIDLQGLSPKNLKLEVTETALVEDPDTAAKHLKQLRDLGCGISIDDFGTGYSNLAYLKKLPLTTIKIDRAFAGDAHSNAVSRSIVFMLLGLGRELGVEIVAEGLETVDDVKTLRELGCEFAQGYYFYKPMPESEILEILDAECRLRLEVA